MHNLKMMHRGSILHNCLYFAVLVSFMVLSSHLECINICQAGKTKGNCRRCGEEELEAEAVVGPSGEATVLSSGNTPPVPLISPCYQFIYVHFSFFSTYHYSSLTLFFFSWQMNPLMRKFPGLRQRRRKILTSSTVGCKWGLSCPTRRRGMGLLLEVGFLSLFFCCPYGFLSPLYIPTPVFLFPFIFQGLDLLKKASSLREEAHRLEVEAQCLETEGLEKMEVAVAG